MAGTEVRRYSYDDRGTFDGPANMRKQHDAIAAQLRDTIGSKIIEAVLDCGKLLFEEFFNGNLKNYMSKDPNKAVSFNALCSHPELRAMGLSGSTLRNYVNVYIQYDNGFIPRTAQSIGLSHRIRLYALRDDRDAVRRLATDAVEENWTVRELQEAIDKHKGPKPLSSRTKHPMRTLSKIFDSLEQLQSGAKQCQTKGKAAMALMEIREIQRHLGTIAQMYTFQVENRDSCNNKQLLVDFDQLRDDKQQVAEDRAREVARRKKEREAKAKAKKKGGSK